jgi:hypothetical protein
MKIACEVVEDLVSGLGPHKRLGVLVPGLDPGAEVGCKCLDAGVDTPLEQPSGQLGEPPLVLGQPGRAGRDEGHLKARVGGQPPLDRVGLVSGVGIAGQVHVQVLGTSWASRARNLLNSMDRCRRCSDPMTCPVAMSRAANRLVTPWRVSRGGAAGACRAASAAPAGSGPAPAPGTSHPRPAPAPARADPATATPRRGPSQPTADRWRA